MTPELLHEICSERSMYTQPHLNTQLFLNYKGFEAIEGLEDYVSVKSLHLSNNCIGKIEGLDRMSDLRSLYLEGNRLTVIEGLSAILELRLLSLESNGIRSLSGLAHLTKLEQLNVAKNCLTSLADLEELKTLPALMNVDVSCNQLEVSEGVVEFWAELPSQLRVLRYHGNPGVRFIEHYRKRLVNSLPELRYLDERPVFPVERRSSAAWAEGGLKAMHQAKKDFHQEQNRFQNGVDPERREFLTRQRKAAIARIEQEERERKEKEAAIGAAKEEERATAQSGDVAALADYEKSWQTKVRLHGIDAVRAQVAKDDAVSQGVVSQAPAAEAPRQTERVVPWTSPQVRAPPTAPHERHEEAAAPSASRFAPPSRRTASQSAGAADFLSRQPASREGEEALQTRQLAVLGDDPWASCATAASWADAAPGPRGTGRGPSAKDAEVIPDLWRELAPANRAAELEALDRNFAAAAEARKPATRAVPEAADAALNMLD